MQLDQNLTKKVKEAIDHGDLENLRNVFADLHPSNVAELLGQLETPEIARIILILRAPKGIEVFERLSLELQAAVLSHLGRNEMIKILEELSPDDRVDLLQKIPPETVDALLPMMAQAERDDVRKLLQYGERTAGSIMTTEYASLPVEVTVADSLSRLRTIAPDRETIYYIYITNAERKLIGTVSLREVVTAKPTQTIREIMSENPIRVGVDQNQEEVSQIIRKYDLLAVPVVDAEDRLVGIVTYDDVLDIMVKEQTEDVQKMGAVTPMEDSYFRVGFWSMARKRGAWLTLLFIEELFTGTALRHYEKTFAQTLALVFFVPLIVSSGGNTGSQSVTLITRALALGEVKLTDFARVFTRECAMGLVLGVFLGLIGLIRAWMWHSSWAVMLTVSFSLLGVIIIGTLVGAILPIIFKALRMDPAIMSSPFVASLVDVVGIVLYFNIAQLLIR